MAWGSVWAGAMAWWQFLDRNRDTPINLIVPGKLAHLIRDLFVRLAENAVADRSGFVKDSGEYQGFLEATPWCGDLAAMEGIPPTQDAKSLATTH